MNSNPSGGGQANGYGTERPVQAQRQLFAVEDALQRTPFASINPFDPETIPFLQPVPPVLGAASLTNNERNAAKAHLQHLDQGIQSSDPLPQAVQQKLQDLHFLLRDEKLSVYHFQPASASPREESIHSNNGSIKAQAPKLGTFAQRLFDSGAFSSSFRYPAQHPSSGHSVRRDPSPQKIRRVSSHLTPQRANQQAVSNNVRAVAPLQPPVTPSHVSNAASPNSTPIVMIPQPSKESVAFFPRDRKTDEELLRQLHESSANKERRSEEANEILRDVDVGQRDKALSSLQHLQHILMTVFEAEESLKVDGDASKAAHKYFEPNAIADGVVPTESALSALDSAMVKAISTKQAAHVPVELLMRLQKLCFRTLVATVDEDHSIPSDLSDDSLQQWSNVVSMAATTISASRLLLRTMTAGRSEKELFSENFLAEVLTNLKKVVEGCVVPVAEMRVSSDHGRRIADNKSLTDRLATVVQRAGRVLKLLGDLLVSCEVSEMAVTTIDFLCMQLIFVSNASSDKESVLGIQRIEVIRRSAMDCLSRVFLRAPAQRRSILDEILSSLEKLPVARQSARHYKIADGRPIQLVSALIMQLIQITATNVAKKTSRSRVKVEQGLSNNDNDDDSLEGSPTKSHSPKAFAPDGSDGLQECAGSAEALAEVAKPLWSNVQSSASYVAQYLVARALKSSKTSEEPYRNLLDIFIEDFLSVLGHTDWPAAELMLQYLLRQLIGIADNEKSNAPAKNMALDLMGIMGSGIADLQASFTHAASNVSSLEDPQAQDLALLCNDYIGNQGSESASLSIHGPYRHLTDYLGDRGSDDIQLQNTRNYHLLQWSQRLSARGQSPVTTVCDEHESVPHGGPSVELTRWLLNSVQHPGHSINDDFPRIPTSIARTAYNLLVLQLTFCKAILRIFQMLLQSMSSTHATIRSRGLRSVVQLLEKDPTILDRNTNIVAHIARAANDQSTMVRDAALSLIGKCVAIRPQIELDFLGTILMLSSDTTVGIRKRAIPHLRQAYNRNQDDDTRLRIASTLLSRMNDEEESMKDLARDTLEEIWIRPYPSITGDSVPLIVQQDLNRHAAQLVEVAEQSEGALQAFEPFFRGLLVARHKNAPNNQGVCRAIASAAFDSFLENDQQRSLDARANILSLVSVLIRACPILLSIEQLKMLETYTSTLKTGADLRLYKPVTQIYHAAMPCFASAEKEFVIQLQRNMIRNLSLIPIDLPDLMDEVTGCLWAMDRVLHNKLSMIKTTQSILRGISDNREGDMRRTLKFIRMAGYFGKAWNLDEDASGFREAFPSWKGDHVAELIVETLLLVAGPQHSTEMRRLALESIGLTCLSWPENYARKSVTDALELALVSNDAKLERVVIAGFRDFFKASEGQSKPSSQQNGVLANGETTEKLGASMVSSDGDKAATLLAQQFFDRIQRLALSRTDETAFAATELICSANRQGLVHPRLCVCVLVALETSPNEIIARIAYDEHLSLNAKHESILEKEYLKAVEQSFVYQRDTIKDSLGLSLEGGPTPKLALFFEVLKSSSMATRKKLLPNLCKRLDINISRLDSPPAMDNHLLFAKFVCQNLALGSYGRVDEITTVCSTLEKIFGTSGNALSQALEPIFTAEDGANVSIATLSQLTIAAMLFTLLWRTRSHLRGVYTNLPIPIGKQDKRMSKDTSKPPLKSTHAARLEESYLKSTETAGILRDPDAMREVCRVFMDLFSVDHDAKVGGSSDDMDGAQDRDVTPDEGSVGTPSAPPSGSFQKPRMKRRRSENGSAAGTPSGRKRGRPKLDKRRSSAGKKDSDDEGWD